MASDSVVNKLPASGLSFPSGHSQSISAISTYVVFDVYKNKSAKGIKISTLVVAILLCLVVGFSRIYLGQHYLTDVLAGLVLGAGVILLLKFIESKIPDKIKQKIRLEVVLAAASLIMLIAVIVVGNFNLGLSYSSITKVFRYAGMLVGASMGYGLSAHFIKEINLSTLTKLIKVAIGFVVTFGVYLLIGLIPLNTPAMAALNVMITGVIATFVYPLIFNLILIKIKKV